VAAAAAAAVAYVRGTALAPAARPVGAGWPVRAACCRWQWCRMRVLVRGAALSERKERAWV
jgi:hypothetical protein